MSIEEYRRMEIVGLEHDLVDRRRELMNLRCQTSMGEDVRPHQVRASRREIARLMTVLNAKKKEALAAQGAEE